MLGHGPGVPEDQCVPPVVGSGGSHLLLQQLLLGFPTHRVGIGSDLPRLLLRQKNSCASCPLWRCPSFGLALQCRGAISGRPSVPASPRAQPQQAGRPNPISLMISS